jgi:hypothetical protein
MDAKAAAREAEAAELRQWANEQRQRDSAVLEAEARERAIAKRAQHKTTQVVLSAQIAEAKASSVPAAVGLDPEAGFIGLKEGDESEQKERQRHAARAVHEESLRLAKARQAEMAARAELETAQVKQEVAAERAAMLTSLEEEKKRRRLAGIALQSEWDVQLGHQAEVRQKEKREAMTMGTAIDGLGVHPWDE